MVHVIILVEREVLLCDVVEVREMNTHYISDWVVCLFWCLCSCSVCISEIDGVGPHLFASRRINVKQLLNSASSFLRIGIY